MPQKEALPPAWQVRGCGGVGVGVPQTGGLRGVAWLAGQVTLTEEVLQAKPIGKVPSDGGVKAMNGMVEVPCLHTGWTVS